MRRLIGVLVVIAVLVAALAIGDIVARHRTQSNLATHIEATLPGSVAKVTITSFPFLGRLATSGTMPELTATMTGVAVGGLTFARVRIAIHDLKLDTSQLIHRHVVLQGISSGTVTAELTQASLDRVTGLPVTLGAGTVGVGGSKGAPSLSVAGSTVTIRLPVIAPITFTLPQLSFLPCVGSVQIEPGVVVLACTLTALPPALAGYSSSF